MRKRLKLLALALARGMGLFKLARWLTAPALRILCYHGTWMGSSSFPGDAMFMHAHTFRARMLLVRQLGFAIVPLAAGVEGISGRRSLPDNPVAITIDDGWYGTYRDMLPVASQLSIPMTLYCDTAHLIAQEPIAQVAANYMYETAPATAKSRVDPKVLARASDTSIDMHQRIHACRQVAHALDIDFDALAASRAYGYMTLDELRRTADAGMDVQLHTHDHTMGDGSSDFVGNQLERNRSALASILRHSPESFRHFCYPSGVVTSGARAAFIKHGVESATTTQKGLAWPGADVFLLPRILDNGALSDLELEAELSGFTELLKRPQNVLAALSWRRPVSPSVAPDAQPPALG